MDIAQSTQAGFEPIRTDKSLIQSPRLNALERERLSVENEAFNKQLVNGRAVTKDLGKDDFLKLLITQLTHQDPTAPLEDKEFIAQMAQFSTLEQITNLSSEMTRLAGHFRKNEALSLLGKVVEIVIGDEIVTGKVEKIKGGEIRQIFVCGKYYDYEQVESVIADQDPYAAKAEKTGLIEDAAAVMGEETETIMSEAEGLVLSSAARSVTGAAARLGIESELARSEAERRVRSEFEGHVGSEAEGQE